MAARRKTTSRAVDSEKRAAQILDATLELAEEIGWDALRLRLVATRLSLSLSDIFAHYRDLDAVADAWFRRTWAEALAPPPSGFAALPARERVYRAMTRWFDALGAHRQVAGQILRAKLYPSHPHHWVPLIFNLSRSIHWLREAAMLDAVGRWRQMEEIGLSALFLATMRQWLRDESPGQEATRATLRRRLGLADQLLARL